MQALLKELNGCPHNMVIRKIHKFTKNNQKLDEKDLKNLENSTQEDLILSIYIAIAYKDKERILKAFEHETASVKWAACSGIHLLDDQTLESVILKIPKAFRTVLLRRIKKDRQKLVVSLFEKILAINTEEGYSLLPYLPDDVALKMMEKYSIQISDLKRATIGFVHKKKDITYKLFLDQQETFLKGSYPNKNQVISGLMKYKEDEMFDILKKDPGFLAQYSFYLKKKTNYLSYLTLVEPETINLRKKYTKRFTVEDTEKVFKIFSKNMEKFMYSFPQKKINKLKVDFFELLKDLTNPSILTKVPSKEVAFKLAVQFMANVEETKKLTSREKIPYLVKQNISKVRKALLDLCSDSDPNNRIQGYNALIDCTVFSDAEYSETMEFLIKKMKTEQDPVKTSIIPSIKSPSFFKDPKSITDLLSPCFEAVDRGSSTYSAMYNSASFILVNFKKSEEHVNNAYSIIKELLDKKLITFNINSMNPKSGEDIEFFLKFFKTQMETTYNVFYLTQRGFRHKIIDQMVENIVSSHESKLKSLLGLVTNLFHQEAFSAISGLIPYFLYDKNTKYERIKRLLNITSLFIGQPNIAKTVIKNDIGFFLDTLESYKSRFSTYPMIFSLIPRYKMRFNHQERERLINYMIDAFNYALKNHIYYLCSNIIRVIGCVQIGKIDKETEKFIQTVASSKDLKISQSAISFYSNMDIVDVKSFFESITPQTVGVIFASSLKRAITRSKALEKELLTYLSNDKFLKNGVTLQKEVLKVFFKLSSDEFLKILHYLWTKQLHKDVRVIVASLLRKYLIYDESLEKLFSDIAFDPYLPLVQELFVTTSLNPKQLALLSKIQFLTLKNESTDVFKYAISMMRVTQESAKLLFSELSQLLLTFPKDATFVQNLSQLLMRCLVELPKLSSDFIGLIKSILSKDKNEGIRSPQRIMVKSLVDRLLVHVNELPFEFFEELTSFLLDTDETYLKTCFKIMTAIYAVETYIEKCSSLKLKTLPDYFVFKLAIESVVSIQDIPLKSIESLAKSEKAEVHKFLLKYLTLTTKINQEFLKSDKGKDYIEKMVNHKDGEIRFTALNL